MTPKTYPLLERCIEDGLVIGFNHAHKHTESPTQSQLFEEQRQAIMSQICEWFDIPTNLPLD